MFYHVVLPLFHLVFTIFSLCLSSDSDGKTNLKWSRQPLLLWWLALSPWVP